MPTFDEQKLFIRAWLSGAGMNRAITAINLGLEWHDGTRKDGVTPEFSHQLWQIQAARTLVGIANLEEVICTIALHDLPEDKKYDLSSVFHLFGVRIGDSVDAMSKKFFGKDVDKAPKNYYYIIGLDENASVAKGLDRVHNQASMPGVFTLAKMEEMMAETEEFVLPMLKEARKKFPHQEPAYSALRVRLKEQIHLIRTCCHLALNPGIVGVDPPVTE